MQPQPHPKFDVFLSHKSSDKAAIRDLKRRLEGEGLTCWLDEDDLLLGDLHADACPRGISESRAVLACIGADGLGPWQTEEVYLAFQRAKRLNRRVIPVLFPGAPEPEDLPSYLPNRIALDLRNGMPGDVPKRIRQAIEKPLGGDATVPNSEPASPSDEAPRPARKDVVQPSPAASADPRPMSPEEEKRRTEVLRRKLSEVFPTTLEALKGSVGVGSPLREVMLKVFKPLAQSEEGQALELLVRFHVEFLPVVGLFIQTYKQTKNPQAKAELTELVGRVLFLSMDPDFARQVRRGNAGADAATVAVPAAAGAAIQQVLRSWIQRHDEVDVGSHSGGTMDVPPQMAVDYVKLNLMQRFGIPASDPNADKLLEIQIELQLNLNDAVAVTIADREVLQEIRRPNSPLRRLLVFIKEQGTAIRPGADDAWFETKVEKHLEALKKSLSTP